MAMRKTIKKTTYEFTNVQIYKFSFFIVFFVVFVFCVFFMPFRMEHSVGWRFYFWVPWERVGRAVQQQKVDVVRHREQEQMQRHAMKRRWLSRSHENRPMGGNRDERKRVRSCNSP